MIKKECLMKMLRVIEGKMEIDNAQTIFINKLEQFKDGKSICSVGRQGGSRKLLVTWSDKLDIWWALKLNTNRYRNAFGIGKPSLNRNIVCEINPPLEGINRRIAGVFAKDADDKMYLLHRGRIGGGRLGIGKDKFQKEFDGTWVSVEDGTNISNLALVAAFESSSFAEDVADFIHKVERIKENRNDRLQKLGFQ